MIIFYSSTGAVYLAHFSAEIVLFKSGQRLSKERSDMKSQVNITFIE